MLKVSLRSLVAFRQRLALTVVAVVVSVAFMTGTQVLTATISARFDQVFSDVYANVDTVVRSATAIDTGLGSYHPPVNQDLVAVVGRASGVAAVAGRVQGLVTIMGQDGRPLGSAALGTPTYGMDWLRQPQLNGWVLAQGRAPSGPDEVVIDRRTASDAGYGVGDRVAIQVVPGLRTFTVVGVAGFGTTPDYAGSAAALFDQPVAQELLGLPGQFSWIEVAAAAGTGQDDLRADVAAQLPQGAEAVTGAQFTRESQDVISQIFDTINKVLLAFGLVAVFVGTFIIYNTFSIIIAQRTRELALLRAMGASRRQVLASVALEATVVGALASAIGLAVGVALAVLLRWLVELVSSGINLEGLSLPPRAFAISFAIGVVITLLSALVPARRAAGVPPVAALRAVDLEPPGHGPGRALIAAALIAAGAGSLTWGLFGPGDHRIVWAGTGILGIVCGAVVAGPALAVPLSRLIGAPLRSFPGRLAQANAMRNPRRTAATASALMIGVALIVMFAIVVQSLKTSIDSGVSSAFTADLIVDSAGFGPNGLDQALVDRIAGTAGVADVLGLQAGVASVGGEPAQVIAADLDRLPSFVRLTTLAGDLKTLADDQVAVPGQAAEEKHLTIGSPVPMTVLQGGERTFHVGAVYEIPGVGGLGYVMSPGGFAASFPPVLRSFNQVHVHLAAGADGPAVRSQLDELVTTRFPTARVVSPSEYGEAQTRQLDVMLLLIYVLLLLAVIIAGLGIINTLLLSVHERTREIGLLRAVGMDQHQVAATVRWESVIFSLQGTAIGMVIGTLFAWALVSALSHESPVFGVALPWLQLAAVPVGALVAGVVAAVLPARSAARLAVLDAITGR